MRIIRNNLRTLKKKNPTKLVSVSVNTVFPEEENESREWSWR